MKMKTISILLAIIALALLGFFYWLIQPAPVKLHVVHYNHLPGWHHSKVKKSFHTFQVSCKTFLRQNPQDEVGSNAIALKAKDWHPACKAALAMSNPSHHEAKLFFQKWFVPVEFRQKLPVKGLFTGYYMPLLHGSMVKTAEYNVPVYGVPDNLISVNMGDFDPHYRHRHLIGRLSGQKLVPYYTRKEITHGAIKDHAPVLLWVNSRIDHLFLEIQGSGVVRLADGKLIYLGYAGENGASYTPVGRVLIAKGVMTKKTASMQGIKKYLEAHPEEIEPVINANKSFVFFKVLHQTAALGAQGVSLTPGYSLAVDRQWIPLGAPLWLSTTRPDRHHQDKHKLQRLMVAQDTGGAIRGIVRGDVFWGAGENATEIAGKMKNPGRYWLLLPRHAVVSGVVLAHISK